jgi:predicted transposase/invertase (TIGR01784 family)
MREISCGLGCFVRTDSLFYRIFSTAPEIFFQLIGQPSVPGYQFQSVEVKQTAFRIDGVFVPPANEPDLPVFFVEVQFQKDPSLYQRLFAEIFLFLQQNPTVADWQAVVVFPRRGLEPEQTGLYRTLLGSPQVQLVYLEDLQSRQSLPVGLGVLQLVVEPPERTPDYARQLLQQAEQQFAEPLTAVIIELIEVTLVYKFPQMSRQEIEAMLGFVDDVKQTRVYQEAREEGLREGLEHERSLILRQLNRRLGTVPAELKSQVEQLPLAQLETLGEALLDFSVESDLRDWLVANS